MPARILILGGGLSGLAAAWRLRARGLDVAVWEAREEAGGWARTVPWPGPGGEAGELELGPLFLRTAPGSAVEGMLASLGLEPLVFPGRSPRWVGRPQGRLPLPASPWGWLRTGLLPLSARLRLLLEPLQGPGPGARDESLHDFARRRLGRRFAEEILPVLLSEFLVADPRALPLSLFPGLARLDRRGGLLRAGGALAQPGAPIGRERSVLPVDGRGRGAMGLLAERLSAGLPGLRTGRRARALEALLGGRWRVLDAEGGSAEADRVLLALPAPEAAALLADVAPGAAELLGAIPQVGLITWHSRHAASGFNQGSTLLLHPRQRPWLGATALRAADPRSLPGLVHMRLHALLEGPAPEAGEAQAFLMDTFPELGPPLQQRLERAPSALALPPWSPAELESRLRPLLPPGLDWVGQGRFGPGLGGALQAAGGEAAACYDPDTNC